MLDAQLFCCWWFEWLSAIRVVEFPSPVFSLGCPVVDANCFPCLLVGQMALCCSIWRDLLSFDFLGFTVEMTVSQ